MEAEKEDSRNVRRAERKEEKGGHEYVCRWEVCVRLRVAFTHSAARDSLGQRMEYQRHH
jgi:hypothetical protein